MTDHNPPPRIPPTWLFGLTGIPFGVAGGYIAVAMPFLLRRVNVPVSTIAAISAASLIPSSYQFFWAPIIDIGPKRRTWLVIVSLLGSLALASSLFLDLPSQLHLFTICCVAGQGITGMVGSCNGGLIATSLPNEVRGKASGWMNAANLGGNAIGGGMVLWLARAHGMRAAGVGVGLVTFLPSLAALFVPEAERAVRGAGEVFRTMLRDVWGTAKTRQGWTGILFCISPVGTAALINLFSAIAEDYHAPERTVEFVNGYWGGLVTAGGALVSGYFLDRINKRAAYLLSGVLTAAVGVALAFAPLTPAAYQVGCLAYLAVTGLCYAAFSAVVFEIIGKAGHSASTQYTLFTAAGNQAIAYVTWLDGRGYDLFKARHLQPTSGMLYTDAAANLVGVGLLAMMLMVVFRKRAPQ